MNAMNVNKILVKREFWENRSLWIVPTVIVGLFALLGLYIVLAVIFGYTHAVNDHFSVSGQQFELHDLPDLSAMEPGRVAMLVQALPFAPAYLISSIVQIVVFFYLLDSLYADRRDRSIYFWRSMPVSDTRTVLSKLGTAMLASTAVTLAAVIACELFMLVLLLIAGSVLGAHPWAILLHPVALIEGWLIVAYGLVAKTLWFLPFYGWLMLASSYARKAPFLWAVMPPVGVVIIEGILFHTGHFARMLALHSVNWMPLAFNLKPRLMGEGDMNMSAELDPVTAESIARFVSSGELWIGFAVAAAFVAGAIWLRRNRSDM